MNNISINQSRAKNSKVSFDVSQIHGQSTNFIEKDNSMQSGVGLGTKFSYTDPKSQAYLNKTKSKIVIDKGSFHSSRYAVPMIGTEVTQIVEGTCNNNQNTTILNSHHLGQSHLNANQHSQCLRQQEKIQNEKRWQQKLEKSRVQYLTEAQEHLSVNKIKDVAIESTGQYAESMINYMNQARENMENAETKHSILLEENIALKKQMSFLIEGVDLQDIRFKYYIQYAYNMLRHDSILLLDQRIFHLLVKNLISDLEPQKRNFNSKIIANFDAINDKLQQNGQTLQNLILDNETVLKFLDYDLQLERFSTHLSTEELEQIQNQEGDDKEATIKALNSKISEKIIEIEKYRIADNNSRQMINSLSLKSEEYERHLQNILGNLEHEPLKNNLKRILEMKKENDRLVNENETLKRINESHEETQRNLNHENTQLAEKLNIYCRKLVQLLLDTNMSDQAVKDQMDELLQKENIDFYLQKRNMEYIKEKFTEEIETKKVNIKQEQEIENLEKQVDLANQTIEQLEKKLIESTAQKQTTLKQIPGLINLDDKSQLQHTIQQLALILLSKDNAVQVDSQTQNLIKQMFSESFDQMIEFQQENIDNLKVKLNETEQKYFQCDAKRIEYLNISFYLSNLLFQVIDDEKDNKIKAKLQKERQQIMNFYGKTMQDFQELIKNPRNVMQVNQWYVNKKSNKNQQENDPNVGNSEELKSQDENMLNDLTVLQSMGVKPLQEYINMRIGRVQEENEKLKEKMKNIKQENVTVIELKKQRLQDEERYERLSRKLQNFCSDNIFTASENNDLIGHFNENFMHSIFMQANTIEEMINKTLEQDEEEQRSRPSLPIDYGQRQDENGPRDSDFRNNQPPVLNHSIIEEKPGEEDEYFEENGKQGKMIKSYKNLQNSQHSSNHEREGSEFDQKIQINISISSPDRSQTSSFVNQPMIETSVNRIPIFSEEQSQIQKKPLQQILPNRQYEEEHLQKQHQYNNQNDQQRIDSIQQSQKSSAQSSAQNSKIFMPQNSEQQKQIPSQNEYDQQKFIEQQKQKSQNYQKQQQPLQQNQQQQQNYQKQQLNPQQIQEQQLQSQEYKQQQLEQQKQLLEQLQQQLRQQQQLQQESSLQQQEQQYQKQPIQQQKIQSFSQQQQQIIKPSFSQTPSFKNTPKSENSIQNSEQKPQQFSHFYRSNQQTSEEEEEPESRQSKQNQYIQQDNRETKVDKERQQSNQSSIHKNFEQIENTTDNNQNNQFQKPQFSQRQKEIQDLKRFSSQNPVQQFMDPSFKKRASEQQSNNQFTDFTKNLQLQHMQSNQSQQNSQISQQNNQTFQQQNNSQSQQPQMNNQQYNQLTQSKNSQRDSQDRQKQFLDTIGQISDIKPSSNKMLDQDNKASFNEHFDMIFGQRSQHDNPYNNQSQDFDDYQNTVFGQHADHQQHFYQQQNQNVNRSDDEGDIEDDGGDGEDSESGYKNYEPNNEDDHDYQDQRDQDNSNNYQESQNQEDSLMEEAPYLNYK